MPAVTPCSHTALIPSLWQWGDRGERGAFVEEALSLGTRGVCLGSVGGKSPFDTRSFSVCGISPAPVSELQLASGTDQEKELFGSCENSPWRWSGNWSSAECDCPSLSLPCLTLSVVFLWSVATLSGVHTYSWFWASGNHSWGRECLEYLWDAGD